MLKEFAKMNVIQEVQRLLDGKKCEIVQYMCLDEVCIYDLGVKNALSALSSILGHNQFIMHDVFADCAYEVDLKEIIDEHFDIEFVAK